MDTRGNIVRIDDETEITRRRLIPLTEEEAERFAKIPKSERAAWAKEQYAKLYPSNMAERAKARNKRKAKQKKTKES